MDLKPVGQETDPAPPGGSPTPAETRGGLIRICHIITRLDRGGSSDNTLLTVLGLQGKGFRFCVVKGPGEPGEPPSPLERQARDRGIEIIELPHLLRPIRIETDLRAMRDIHRILKRGRFDIVHTHSSKAGLLGRIAARREKVPAIVHTPHGHVFYGYFGPLRSRLFLQIERWTARYTDRIITLTERGREEHLAYGVGRPAQYAVIPSGLPLADFFPDAGRRRRARAALDLPPEVPVLGTVGRLTAVKDQITLLRAASRLAERFPRLAVLLVGDGELRGKLEAAARDLRLESHVRFLGWRTDVPELLNALDLFVLCSRNEGMGRALVEAMASGLPAVATRVGGIPDLIRPGQNGHLVSPGDAAELADRAARLLENPDDLRRMGRKARELALTFTVERMNGQLEDLYRSLARGRAA